MFGLFASIYKHAKFLFHTMMFLGFKRHHIIDTSIPKLTSSIITLNYINPDHLTVFETPNYNFIIQPQVNMDDQIIQDEEVFVDSEKEDGMYLGYVSDSLLDVAIQPSTFFKYPFTNIKNYLDLYNHTSNEKRIEIMKLVKTNVDGFTVYTVFVKTLWLRLIQRHWKKMTQNLDGRESMLRGLMSVYK
jgi:hypothetical protein